MPASAPAPGEGAPPEGTPSAAPDSSPSASAPLRSTSGSGVLVAALLGVASTVAFYAVFVWGLFPDTWFHEMFAERGFIPYTTTFFTGMGGTLLVLAWRRLLAEEKGFVEVRRAVLGQEKLDLQRAALVHDELTRLEAKSSGQLVWNRFDRALLRLKEGVRSKDDLLELLRDVADIDYAIAQNRHGPVKTIIWLIPILGFIGTVFGISAAIAGFSKLFEGTNDFEAAKAGLSGASMYLGVAFDTTLLALIKTAVLMVSFSAIQKREKAFLIQLDEFCADDLMKRVVPLVKVEEQSETAQLTAAVAALTTAITSWDPRFVETLDGFFDRAHVVSEEIGGRMASQLHQLDAVLERHVQAADASYASLRQSREEHIAALQARTEAAAVAGDAFVEKATSQAQAAAAAGAAFVATLETWSKEHAERVTSERSQMLEALAGVLNSASQRSVEQNEVFVRALGERLETARENLAKESAAVSEALAEGTRALAALQARSVEHAAEHVANINRTVDRQLDASEQVREAALQFAAAVQRIGAVEESVQRSVEAVTALTEFNACLASLRESTQQLPAVIDRLSRPRRVTLIEAAEEV